MSQHQCIILLLTICTFLGGNWSQASEAGFQIPTEADEIKIMTYNVYNLFDTRHDKGKQDYTFLPQSHPRKEELCHRIQEKKYRRYCLNTDWTAQRLQTKLEQLKTAIAQQGSLPDVLALTEVENKRVTKQLAEVLGYSHFLVTNSPDGRGIDVALLYKDKKLKYLSHKEITTEDVTEMKTRNVLRVHFRPRQGASHSVLAFYVNHWPAMMVSPWKRVQIAEKLSAIIDKQISEFGEHNYHVVALGDFNSAGNEMPDPFHHVLSTIYWKHRLHDVQELFENTHHPARFHMPPSSYFYRNSGTWQKLDRIAISENLMEGPGLKAKPKSFRIVAAPKMTRSRTFEGRSEAFYPRQQRTPKPFKIRGELSNNPGFSDHLPIVVKLQLGESVAQQKTPKAARQVPTFIARPATQ